MLWLLHLFTLYKSCKVLISNSISRIVIRCKNTEVFVEISYYTYLIKACVMETLDGGVVGVRDLYLRPVYCKKIYVLVIIKYDTIDWEMYHVFFTA